MESIRELREQLQKMKVEGRERPWAYRLLQRGPSIYITRILLSTRISANQVTALAIFFGIVGSIIVYYAQGAAKSIGVLFFYGSILLDKVDGEVARYRRVFSLRGIYLDEIYHLAIPPLFFIALTFGLASFTIFYDRTLFFFGTIAAVAMPMIRIGHSLAPQIYSKKYLKHPELFTLPPVKIETKVEAAKHRHRLVRIALSIAHQFQEFFMILAVFLATLNYEYFFRPDYLFYPITAWAVICFGALLPLVFVENTIKGFWGVEKRIAELAERFRRDPHEAPNNTTE